MKRSIPLALTCEECGHVGMTYTVIEETGAGGDGILRCGGCGAETSEELSEAQRRQIAAALGKKPHPH